MIKGIMFDMGGTLIDSIFKKSPANIIYDHLNTKNVSIVELEEFIQRLINDTLNVRTTFDISFKDFLNTILKYFNASIDISVSELEILYEEALADFTLVPKVAQVLEKCKKEGLKLIVLSNTFFSSNAISKILKDFDILKYFDKVIASSECLVRKPSTIFFEIGLKEIGLNKNEVMYVGNDYNFDVMGCLMTGIPMVFYNKNNYGKYELFETIKEIKDYEELLGVEICKIF